MKEYNFQHSLKKMVNLDSLFDRTIVMIGRSGAGKSRQQAAIDNLGEEKKMPVFTISTGALFRGLKSNSISNQMGQGAQIPSLEPIASDAVQILEDFIVSCLREENPILVTDGVPRNSEDVTPKGERIPSQILQFSEMFFRAGNKVLRDHLDLVQTAMAKGIIDSKMVREFYDHKPVDCGVVVEEGFLAEIGKSFREHSNFVIIDVTAEAGEEFMRSRFAKTTEGDLIPAIKVKVNAETYEKSIKTISHLDKLLLIQRGRFIIEDGKVVLGNSEWPDKTFSPFDSSAEHIALVDGKVKEICLDILTDLEVTDTPKDKEIVSKAFTVVQSTFGLPDEVMPRNDDVTEASRLFRGEEHNNKVQKNLLKKELGIEINYDNTDGKSPARLDLKCARVNVSKVGLIVNGVDRNIGLDLLEAQSAVETDFISRNMAPGGVEASLKKSTER